MTQRDEKPRQAGSPARPSVQKRKLTAKQRVLKKYPGAEYSDYAIWIGWIPIGYGPNPHTAWAAAARRLK